VRARSLLAESLAPKEPCRRSVSQRSPCCRAVKSAKKKAPERRPYRHYFLTQMPAVTTSERLHANILRNVDRRRSRCAADQDYVVAKAATSAGESIATPCCCAPSTFHAPQLPDCAPLLPTATRIEPQVMLPIIERLLIEKLMFRNNGAIKKRGPYRPASAAMPGLGIHKPRQNLSFRSSC